VDFAIEQQMFTIGLRHLAGSVDTPRCCRNTTWCGCRSQADHSGSSRTDSAAAIKEEAEGSQVSATAAASDSTRDSASSPATTATTAGRPESLLTLPLTLPDSPPAAADVDPPDDPGMPSPFVRWAALQRAASSGMAPAAASLDPSASGQLARGGGGSAERLRGSWASLSPGSGDAATLDGSVHGSSYGSGAASAASSVVLSPASQGLLMPRVASNGLATLDSTPTASLAAAFQAVATPPEAPAALAAGPQGSTYSRIAYASQPTIWSCSPVSSAAASPPPDAAAAAWPPGDTLTSLPLPPRPLLTPGPPPPTLALALHSNSDTWEAGRLVPRSRAGREWLGTNLLGGADAGGGAPPTGSAPQQLRFSVPEAIAAASGPGRGGGGAVTTIPEASPPAVERTPPMLRLSSLQAPSLEMTTAASRLDAARSVLHVL